MEKRKMCERKMESEGEGRGGEERRGGEGSKKGSGGTIHTTNKPLLVIQNNH